MIALRRGMKVVCIVNWWNTEGKPISCPQENQVYTVRDIREVPDDKNVPCAILLYEIRNPIFQWRVCASEPHFNINGFRPAVTRETDISVFTELLKKKELETEQ